MKAINFTRVDEISLNYSPRIPISERPKVLSSLDAFNILKDNWSSQISLIEEFNILLLDNANHVLGLSNISKGGLTSTIVDIRVAFVTALKAKSSCMILSHNHPSGNTKPSTADIKITQKFMDAGKILNIKIIDHIILTPQNAYFSFIDEGLVLCQ